MEILFIGSACSSQQLETFNKKYYDKVSNVHPQQHFDYSLLLGLSKYSNVLGISEPPIESFPKSKCLIFKGEKEKINKSLQIKYLPLLNVTILKQFFIFIFLLFESLKFGIRNRAVKNKYIVLGYITFYRSIPAIMIAKILKIRIITIVPDIPAYYDDYSTKQISLIKKKYKKLTKSINYKIQHISDGFIFLTEQMNELLNINHKPYIVVEGFINPEDYIRVNHPEKLNVLMYAGTLHKKFGVDIIANAFIKAQLLNYELWIYGNGDYLDEILILESQGSGIKYKGVLNKDDILEIETKVKLLINCRPDTEEYTKYSFPSKTLEYMASGTPFVTTKLPGIPKEYYKYIYVFNNNEVGTVASTIKEIINLDPNELNQVGMNARKFVMENKNIYKQGLNITNFLYHL